MLIVSPGTLSAISHAVNTAYSISISTQPQSSLNSQAFPNVTAKPTLTSTTTVAQASNTSQCGTGQARDKTTWPYACDSIWNMPIGSGAQYVDAYIGSKKVGFDIDWFIVTKQSDPAVPMYMPPVWGEGRCTGTILQQQAQWHPAAGQQLNVPYDLIIPDAITSGGIYSTPNSSSAFLKPDGRTLVSLNVTARCLPGGPIYGSWFGETDIYGNGIDGGHGGSGMSSIGGSIRKGELLNDEPIRHALKIDLWGKWLYYNSSSPTPGYRWPARLADFGAPNQYKGSNPALVMGSLLAIPPNVTAQSLRLTTKTGKKIFQALQDYGAYVVDDSGWNYNYLCIEQSAQVEYEAATGKSIDKDNALQSDFAKIMGAVKVVNNNGPQSIGGGGTPRQPLAPPIGN